MAGRRVVLGLEGERRGRRRITLFPGDGRGRGGFLLHPDRFALRVALDDPQGLLVFQGQELGGQPAEDIVGDRLGDGDLGVAGEARRFEARVGELVDQHLERHAILQGQRNGGGEGVHHARDHRTFLGHGQEDLAGLAVGVESHRDVALVAADAELVGDGLAFVGQAPAVRPGTALAVGGGGFADFFLLPAAGVERLGALAAVAVDGHGLEAHLPRRDIGLLDFLGGRLGGQVDGLGNRPGNEGLHGGHHGDVAHVVDRAGPVVGLEGAIEDGQVLVPEMGRALDGVMLVDVADDLLHLFRRVAQAFQGGRNGLVDDLEHAAAHQVLVLDQGDIRFDAGGVAIHHEADGSRGGEDGHLGVAEAVLFSEGISLVPDAQGLGAQGRGRVFGADLPGGLAVHADDVQHWFTVLGERLEGPHGLGDAGALAVGLAAEEGGHGGRAGPPRVAVVGQSVGHEQRPQVGVAQPQGAVHVALLADAAGRIAGVVDDDLLRGDDDIHGMLEPLHVERAVLAQVLEQVERREVAGRVVEEHILGTRVGSVDPAGVRAGVPAVDGGVELQAGIAADVGALGDHAQ